MTSVPSGQTEEDNEEVFRGGNQFLSFTKTPYRIGS